MDLEKIKQQAMRIARAEVDLGRLRVECEAAQKEYEAALAEWDRPETNGKGKANGNDLSVVAHKVMTFMTNNQGVHKTAEIVKATGGNPSHTAAVIRQLAHAKKLRKLKRGWFQVV